MGYSLPKAKILDLLASKAIFLPNVRGLKNFYFFLQKLMNNKQKESNMRQSFFFKLVGRCFNKPFNKVLNFIEWLQ